MTINNSDLLLAFRDYEGFHAGTPPLAYVEMVNGLKSKIKKLGFTQEDKRMSRTVYALSGDFLVVKDRSIMDYLSIQEPLPKYRDDWFRMMSSFVEACANAKQDFNSRQLMVFNDYDFRNVKQCFTSVQFVYTHRNEFDMYIYQRSSDLEKLKDDLIFFRAVADMFEEQVKQPVTKIVVIYGNIHFTKE